MSVTYEEYVPKKTKRANPLVQLRFTPPQAKVIRQYAKQHGFTVAALARFALLSVIEGKPLPVTSFELEGI